MRDAIKNSLKERSIATEIYYPLALHAQNIYKPLGYKDIDLPNSIKATESVLCLPIYPELDESDIEAVIEGFTSY